MVTRCNAVEMLFTHDNVAILSLKLLTGMWLAPLALSFYTK